MKKLILSIALLAITVYANGANYRAVPMEKATLVQDGKNKKYCNICGMTLPMFYKTNHAAKHNSHDKQYCSIVCLVEDVVSNGSKLTDFKVVDNTTLKFIDSQKAYFVVGSKKPGTMSMLSKYAFGTKEAALKFSELNGGKVMNFNDIYKLVEELQAKTMSMVKKKQAMMMKKGGMMYKKMCQKTDKQFSSTAYAKSFLVESKICGNIKGKKLQAIGMYLVNRK